MPEQQSNDASPEVLARRLDEAWERRAPIAPLSDRDGLASVEEAYAVQTAWSELRRGRGERTVGRKVGLTSAAMQKQFGVAEPDYGSLWASRHFEEADGRVQMAADAFLQPRLEGEIAFLIGDHIGEDASPEEVLAATESLAVAVEVVDSRIEDWRIKLADTIADNASYGAFATGPWSRELKEIDLRPLRMRITRDGQTVSDGRGEAALGHPGRAVAWLAGKLATFGVALEAGDIVLSGSLGPAVPVAKGDEFVIELEGQPSLTVAFA